MIPKTNSEEPEGAAPEGTEERQAENLAAQATAAPSVGGTGTIKVSG